MFKEFLIVLSLVTISASRALKVTLLTFPIWGASFSTMAASETGQQTTTKTLELDQTLSKVPINIGEHVNKGDRITIFEKAGRVLDLIVTEISATEQPALESDISGTYVSDIRGGWAGILGGNRKLKITLKQSGKDIIGTDVNQKKIVTGTRKEDTIKFEYYGRGSYLTGEWKIKSDGTKLEGTWNSSRENGKWNLTRVDSKVRILYVDTPFIKGKLTSDQSPVEVMLVDIDRIEIQQTPATEELPPFLLSGADCQMSEAARDAIEEARAQLKQEKYRGQMSKLSDQAEAAARLPECDNNKAIELADHSKRLAGIAEILGKSSKSSQSSKSVSSTPNSDQSEIGIEIGVFTFLGADAHLYYRSNESPWLIGYRYADWTEKDYNLGTYETKHTKKGPFVRYLFSPEADKSWYLAASFLNITEEITCFQTGDIDMDSGSGPYFGGGLMGWRGKSIYYTIGMMLGTESLSWELDCVSGVDEGDFDINVSFGFVF